MLEETKKHHLLKIAAIALMTFIIAFLAFYIVMEIMLNKITDPMYNAKRIEKMVQQQQKSIQKFEDRIVDNPFEPKMRPMIVNLVKEASEYKVIVDLKPLDGNDKDINVKIDNNELTVSGELDKTMLGNEKIIKFTQTYYLDEELETEKITKERKGDKYIITIPYKV